MKAFVLSQADIDKLLLMVDRNPSHGELGGSSQAMGQQERDAHDMAHRFYNYQVRAWIAEVTR